MQMFLRPNSHICCEFYVYYYYCYRNYHDYGRHEQQDDYYPMASPSILLGSSLRLLCREIAFPVISVRSILLRMPVVYVYTKGYFNIVYVIHSNRYENYRKNTILE